MAAASWVLVDDETWPSCFPALVIAVDVETLADLRRYLMAKDSW